MRQLPGFLTFLFAVTLGLTAHEARAQRTKRTPRNSPAQVAKPQEPPAPVQGLAVLEARFGTDKRWMDVTQLVRSEIKNDQLNYDARGLPDIAYGTNKSLVIAYTINGKLGLSITRADVIASLSATEDANQTPAQATVPIPQKGLAILAARYGITDKWEDVTAPLQAKVVKNRLEIAAPTRIGLPDPAPDTHKALVIAYAVDGKVNLWARQDDQPLMLSDKIPPSDLVVLEARFGADQRWIDVTELVRSEIRNNQLDYDARGLPDIAYGTNKSLVIAYTINGKAGLSITRADVIASLSAIEDAKQASATVPIPKQGLAILAARYGITDKWEDVTAPLQAKVARNRLELAAPSRIGLPDPAPDAHKALVIAYAVNGKVNLWARQDDRAVTLPELRRDKTDDVLTMPTQADLDYLKPLVDSLKNARLADLVSLETLNLAESPVDDAGLTHLRGLANLKTLHLIDTKVGNPGLKAIAGLPKLETLFLSNTAVGDAGMATLNGMVQLRELNLYGTKLTNAGLAQLKSLQNLEDLTIYMTQVSNTGLSSLKSMPKLKRLRIGKEPKSTAPILTDAALAHFKGLRDLEELSVFGCDIKGTSLPLLKVLPALEHLDLSFTQVNDAVLASIQDFPALTTLVLNGTSVGDAGMAHLKHFPMLQNLQVNDTGVSDAGLVPLVELKGLERLSLTRTKISDAGMVQIGKMTQLLSLTLRTTNIHRSGIIHLKDLRNLQRLDLAFTQIDDASLPLLTSLTSLTQLHLSGPKITNAGLESLKQMRGLTDLILHEANVTDEAVADLRKAIPGLRTLQIQYQN